MIAWSIDVDEGVDAPWRHVDALVSGWSTPARTGDISWSVDAPVDVGLFTPVELEHPPRRRRGVDAP
jgi:hypothetical protein